MQANDTPLILETTPLSTKRSALARLKRSLKSYQALFILTVLFPTLVAGVYYGLIASERFISE